MGVQETADVGLEVLLSLVGASPALRQVRGPTIYLAEWVDFKSDYFCSSKWAS